MCMDSWHLAARARGQLLPRGCRDGSVGQKRPAWPCQRNPGGLKDALLPSPAPPSLHCVLRAQLGISCAGVTEICTDGKCEALPSWRRSCWIVRAEGWTSFVLQEQWLCGHSRLTGPVLGRVYAWSEAKLTNLAKLPFSQTQAPISQPCFPHLLSKAVPISEALWVCSAAMGTVGSWCLFVC